MEEEEFEEDRPSLQAASVRKSGKSIPIGLMLFTFPFLFWKMWMMEKVVDIW